MKDVTTVSFNNDFVRSNVDAFIPSQSVAAAALPAVVANGQRLADIQSTLEIVVEADTNLVVGTTAIAVKLQKCLTKDGTFTDVKTLYTSPVSTTIPAGQLYRETVNIIDDYFYKAVATSAVGNSGSLTVYPHTINR